MEERQSPAMWLSVRDASSAMRSSLRGTLDDNLWSLLPEELLERIIAKLPVPAILNLRCVCKSWHSMIYSRHFQNLCCGTHPRTFLFLGTSVDYRKASRAYSPLSNKWHDLALNIPEQIRGYQLFLLASAGGLLFFTAALNNAATFFICNPVTNRWRRLPPTNCKLVPCYDSEFNMITGMTFDRVSATFKIIVAGVDQSECQTTEVYHSDSNSWKSSGKIAQVGDYDTLDGLVCSGNIYYIVAGPFRVMAYDFGHDHWHQLEAPTPRGLVQPHLVERLGRLLLIGGVSKNWHTRLWPKPQSIRIWQFDSTRNLWVEKVRMPREVRKKFLRVFHGNYCDFNCIGQGNVLYFTRKRDYTFPVVRFDFRTGSWTWLEGIPRVYVFEHAIVFNPTLNDPS